MPLPSHDRANPASNAAHCANEQGKFWEMHAKLFANQQSLADADLERYAGEIGLNAARWKADMQSPKLGGLVDADQALGNAIGASGTPTFFINGKQLVGAQPVDTFKSKIDAELAYAESLARATWDGFQGGEPASADGGVSPPRRRAPEFGGVDRRSSL